jgi:hypothetical protein
MSELMLIENDQALYKGPFPNWPTELWNVRLKKWEPYKGSIPKDGTWGNVVTPEQAEGFKQPFVASNGDNAQLEFPGLQ